MNPTHDWGRQRDRGSIHTSGYSLRRDVPRGASQKVYRGQRSNKNTHVLQAWRKTEVRRWIPVINVMAKIERLTTLADDWDERGASAASALAVAKAHRLLTQVGAAGTFKQKAKVDAVIAPDGGFLLEWDSNHRVVQVEVGVTGELSVIYADDPDSIDAEWHELNNVDMKTATALANSAC